MLYAPIIIDAFVLAIMWAISLSYFKPVTSLIASAPAAMASSATFALGVSAEIGRLQACLTISIACLILLSVSSILPPRCKIGSRQEGRKYLRSGQVVFTIIARSATNEPNRLIAASIGLARPADNSQYGYLSEHHSTGETS